MLMTIGKVFLASFQETFRRKLVPIGWNVNLAKSRVMKSAKKDLQKISCMCAACESQYCSDES